MYITESLLIKTWYPNIFMQHLIYKIIVKLQHAQNYLEYEVITGRCILEIITDRNEVVAKVMFL